MTKTILVGFVGLLLGLAVMVFASSPSSVPVLAKAEQQAPHGGIGPDIPSPNQWVPFVANARSVVTIDGVKRVRMEGRYYRRSDGSTRFETGPEKGPIKTIAIKNIATTRFYRFSKNHWQSNPMQLRDGGYLPAKRREDLRGMEKHAEALSGFLVYRYTDRGGLQSLQAPDLNFFALRTWNDDTTQEFFDVQLGEQADDLFEPPLGVNVEEKPEPWGIIQGKRAQ